MGPTGQAFRTRGRPAGRPDHAREGREVREDRRLRSAVDAIRLRHDPWLGLPPWIVDPGPDFGRAAAERRRAVTGKNAWREW